MATKISTTSSTFSHELKKRVESREEEGILDFFSSFRLFEQLFGKKIPFFFATLIFFPENRNVKNFFFSPKLGFVKISKKTKHVFRQNLSKVGRLEVLLKTKPFLDN